MHAAASVPLPFPIRTSLARSLSGVTPLEMLQSTGTQITVISSRGLTLPINFGMEKHFRFWMG